MVLTCNEHLQESALIPVIYRRKIRNVTQHVPGVIKLNKI